MEIRPIISALWRSKVPPILIGLQVALTLAIVSNALFIINRRLELMSRPSGMNESDTFCFSSAGFGADFDSKATLESDLSILRRLPGVAAATSTNSVPMIGGGWGGDLRLQPNQSGSTAKAAFYVVDADGLKAFGAQLIAGRDFSSQDVTHMTSGDRAQPATVIITSVLANKLFPQQQAVGKQVYLEEGPSPSTIIGIVDRMQEPWTDDPDIENVAFVPAYMAAGNKTRYVVRSEPGQRDQVMKSVDQELLESNPSRVISKLISMHDVRRTAYARDRAMAIILGAVIFGLLGITALGVVGMASFWVSQRTIQIGTRRALGATRLDILRYFHLENLIITTVGIAAGAILAYVGNLWLVRKYGLPLLPWYYVPVGCICLWALGQLAVLAPAVRASRVPPAVATRSL